MAILAWVLMVNHLHLVTQSPPEPLFRRHTSRRTPCRHYRPLPKGHPNSSVISRFMKRVRRSVSALRHRDLGIQGRFWEGPYDARPVRHRLSLVTRIAYDHLNPVKAGVVDRAEEYEWSSARCWATGEPGPVPVAALTEPLGVARAQLVDEVLRHQESKLVLRAMAELARRGVDWSSDEGVTRLRDLLDSAF